MSLSGKEAVKLLKNSGFVLQRVDRNGHYQMQRGDQRIMLAPMKPELDPAIEHRVRRLATNNPAARDLRRLSDNRLLPEEPAETGILVGARVAHIFAGLVGTVAEEDSGVLKVKWDGKDYTSRLPSENVRVLEEGTEMVEPEPIRQEEARPATATPLQDQLLLIGVAASEEYDLLVALVDRIDLYNRTAYLAGDLGVVVKPLPFQIVSVENRLRPLDIVEDRTVVTKATDGDLPPPAAATAKTSKISLTERILDFVKASGGEVPKWRISQRFGTRPQIAEALASLVEGGRLTEKTARGSGSHGKVATRYGLVE